MDAYAIETGTAQANLLGGLSMAFTNDLNFGVILPPAEGDQITMSENTYSPSLTSASGGSLLSGIYTRGVFTITGTPNTLAAVQVSASTSLTGLGEAMIVDNFLVNRTQPDLGATGSTDVVVGGRLNINANQTPGNYTGTYVITVTYM